MKRIYMILCATILVASCKFELPIPEVIPNPAFGVSGLQRIPTVTIYETTDVDIELSRTYGLSKEITLDIAVDESIVSEYNRLYSSSYKVMDAKYYEVPATVTFIPNTQKAVLSVKIKTAALVKDLKAQKEDAQNYLIPIRLAGASMEVKDFGSLGSVLVGLNTSEPTITVRVPEVAEELSFLSVAPINQIVTISADANFTTLDLNKVSLKVDETKVSEFNEANGTSYAPIPTSSYEILKGTFDKEALKFTSNVSFKSDGMEDGIEYLCPLVLENKAGYSIEQSSPVYVIASLTELKAWATDGGTVITIPSYQAASAEIQINAPLTEDLDVSFVYDAEALATYNAKNGTSFKPISADKVVIGKAVVKASGKKAVVDLQVNSSDLPYDGEERYVVPISVDRSKFPSGTQFAEEKQTVFVEILKTITGDYNKTVDGVSWAFDLNEGDEITIVPENCGQEEQTLTVAPFTNNETGYNSIVPTIFLTAGSAYDGRPQKYYLIYGGNWRDGIILFDLNDVPDENGLYSMKNISDRPEDYDPLLSKSRFNPVDGSWDIQFAIFGYWNTRKLFCRLTR